MKRVQAAFLQQTLRFTPKEGIDPKYAAQAVQDEITQYKNRMEYTRCVSHPQRRNPKRRHSDFRNQETVQ